MKIALVSDLHIHNWREFTEPGKGDAPPSRLADCADVLSEILEHCLAFHIGTVVIGGDLFHKRGVQYTQPYNLVVNALAKFKRHDIAVLIVDGNHDHADRAGRVHVVQALRAAELVQSISPAYGFENWHLSSDDSSDELVITGLAYCDGRALFDERLAQAEVEYQLEYDGVDRIYVCHHGFAGARVGSALEYMVKEEIDAAKAFKSYDYDMVFSGHYHQRQLIAREPDMMYIGSPLEHMRGDSGPNPKGFIVYDSTTKAHEVITLNRPRFVTLTQADLDAKRYDEVKGNFIDVRYEGLAKSPADTNAMFRKLGARGVHLVPVRKTRATATSRLDVDLTTDRTTLLTEYIKHAKPTDLDAAALLALGQELLDQVQP